VRIVESYQPVPAEPSSQELISVVVAVYNIEAYVERCVRSLMAQTYGRLEILLVDDGSTDGSGALCDALTKEDPRIRVLHKENGGLSDARNAGVKIASGSLIAFVDGDDWVEPGMYADLYACIRDFDAPIAVCRYRQIYLKKTIDGSTSKAVVLEGSEALEQFIAENDAVPLRNAAWNKLYRRELMGELRFPEGKLYEDIVYTTKLLARADRLVYLDRAEYNYVCEREGSIMGKGLGERIFTDQIPAYREKEAFLRSIGREDLAWQHRYFFYKRLLLYYNRCLREGSGRGVPAGMKQEQKRYRERIRALVLEGRREMDQVYGWPGAGANERRKMQIFLASPFLYRIMTELNERILLPLKTGRA